MAAAQGDRIAVLRKEHAEIAHRLSLARRSVRHSPAPSTSRFCSSVDRLRSLVEAHFEEEEETLYAPLRVRLRRDSPVGEMANEHRAMRRTLVRLSSAAVAYTAGRAPIGEVATCLSSLERELGAHVQKEEEVLFWLADLKL